MIIDTLRSAASHAAVAIAAAAVAFVATAKSGPTAASLADCRWHDTEPMIVCTMSAKAMTALLERTGRTGFAAVREKYQHRTRQVATIDIRAGETIPSAAVGGRD